jgi:hypothetical protein
MPSALSPSETKKKKKKKRNSPFFAPQKRRKKKKKQKKKFGRNPQKVFRAVVLCGVTF